MAEGESVLGEQFGGAGGGQPGLKRRGPRDGVDGDEPVQSAQVEGDVGDRGGASPPTTEVPPPKGTTAT